MLILSNNLYSLLFLLKNDIIFTDVGGIMKDKYVLCFKGKNSSGKEEIYKIYESSLNNIDMYTCYKGCYSNRDLYNLLPSDIQKYLNSFSCFLKKS